MTTIGSFTKQSDGYTGTLRTLTLNVKVKIIADHQGQRQGARLPRLRRRDGDRRRLEAAERRQARVRLGQDR